MAGGNKDKHLDDKGLEYFYEKLKNKFQERGSQSSFSLTDFIAAVPTYYKRPTLMTSAHTTLTVPANTQVNIGGKGYVNLNAVTLNISAVGTADARKGKDYTFTPASPQTAAQSLYTRFP